MATWISKRSEGLPGGFWFLLGMFDRLSLGREGIFFAFLLIRERLGDSGASGSSWARDGQRKRSPIRLDWVDADRRLWLGRLVGGCVTKKWSVSATPKNRMTF